VERRVLYMSSSIVRRVKYRKLQLGEREVGIMETKMHRQFLWGDLFDSDLMRN